MDESKLGMTRRRRVASAPRLEHLEGRRLMTAAPTQVGIKEMAASGYNELKISGTNKADVITINDNGSTAAGNVTVTLGNGTTYTSQSAISVIEVAGAGGDDNVTFNLTGDIVSAQSVLVDLGAGNDHFTANIAGNINTANGLDLEAYGDAGNDSMTVNQTGQTLAGAFVPYMEGDAGNDTLVYNGTGNIAAGASVTPEFSGGAGNDNIKATYSGVIQGNYIYNLSADGGAGNDNIAEDVNVLAGSTGMVGTNSTTPAAVEGGAGNDNVRFAVAVDPSDTTFQVNGVAMGNAGKDTVSRTSNITGDKSNEKDVVLS